MSKAAGALPESLSGAAAGDKVAASELRSCRLHNSPASYESVGPKKAVARLKRASILSLRTTCRHVLSTMSGTTFRHKLYTATPVSSTCMRPKTLVSPAQAAKQGQSRSPPQEPSLDCGLRFADDLRRGRGMASCTLPSEPFD